MPRKKKTPPPTQQNSGYTLGAQQDAVKFLREEVDYLHTISLILMEERGILPPFYGGAWLDDATREVLPLWVDGDSEGADQLGLVLLRVRNQVEPNRDLRQARRLIGISNSWPVERLLQALGTDGQPIPIEGNDSLRHTRIALALFGEQCTPAPGYTYEGMMDAFADEIPMAIFVHVPVIGDGETFFYAWGDVEFYRAEVVYAETPEELEMAVWRYRLDTAMAVERFEVEVDGANPEAEMLAIDVASLTGVFDVMVMDSVRYYGVTSPVKEKQVALDVLRGLDGDLVVPWPLKPEAEPVKFLADMRVEMNENANKTEPLVRIGSDSDIMTQLWPQIRAKTHFCMRFRRARIGVNKSGQPRVQGYLDKPLIEWIQADSLDELYRRATLHSLRQLLMSTGRIKANNARPIQEFTPDEISESKEPPIKAEKPETPVIPPTPPASPGVPKTAKSSATRKPRAKGTPG